MEENKTQTKRKRGRPVGSVCTYKIGRSQKFTKAMEIFCQEIVAGKTEIDAVKKAYPTIKEGGRYSKAHRLLDKLDIQERIEEIKKNIQLEMDAKYSWTREEAIKDLRELSEQAKKEIEQFEQARQSQIQLYEEMIDEELARETPNISTIRELREHIALLKQKRNMTMTQVNAIKGSIDSLNTMHGYNEYNVNNNVSGSGVVEIQFDYGEDDE